jgi:hypothetical protein
MSTEEKWKANLEKVAWMKRFPGLLGSWEALKDKTIEAVIPLKGKQGAAETLAAGRSLLEPKHGDAYREYDRLCKKDKEALKQARLEKIIGAIENNLQQIPELKERLKALVKEWP